jgi:hypothetical protein
MNSWKFALIAGALALGVVGCGGNDDNDMDSSVPPDSSTGDANDGAVEPTCANPTDLAVSGTITADTTWGCEHNYVLSGQVFVQNNATLTIEAGTEIRGNDGAVLIVTRGSDLQAVGTAADPIIFTSNQPVGERRASDWGGVLLLGNATVNEGENVFFEAGDMNDQRYYYGPNNGGTANDDTGSCGNLQFVEIHFGGFPIMGADNKEYNGLTVGGCGSGTTLSNIHVHRGSDDGIEFFGGAANLDHAVITFVDDDGLDWDFGWSGRAQFLVIHMLAAGDKGIEANNNEAGTLSTPRSAPTVYNMTLVGAGGTEVGAILRAATRGIIRNSIIQNWGTGFNIAPANGSEADWGTTLLVEHTFFHNAPIDIGNATFMDADQLTNAARNNVTNVDPLLNVGTEAAPNYVPTSAGLGNRAVPGAGFDASATYAGAVAPNATGAAVWYSWMTFPED